MTKKLLTGFLLLSLVLALTAYAQKRMVPQFLGGIDHPAAKICLQKIKQSSFQLKNQLANYQQCVKSVLSLIPQCQQSFVFFKLTSGGIFNRVRHYKNVDVILADYVYIADQGTGYFLVMKNGQFLALPLNIPKKNFQAAPGYVVLKKKFPHVSAWQILGFPYAVNLSPQRYRLVFRQQLKDGCNACALAGIANVAYDFSTDGKQFYGLRVLKLMSQ